MENSISSILHNSIAYAKDDYEQLKKEIEQLKAQKASATTDYVSLIEEIMPSIVLIETDFGFGSGFFVNKWGDILTNYHIVKNARNIIVKTQNNDVVNAQLRNYDTKKDIALLTTQLNEPTMFLRISNTLPKQGETILAIGHPEGFTGTVSNGIVSALRGTDDNVFIQFTAPVSPGSSGGVLVNMLGEVVGMPSLGMKIGQNLNFAVASIVLSEFLSNLNTESISRLVAFGTPEQMKKALKSGANFVDENYQHDYDYGDSPLHTAATYNHNPKSIVFLISQGIDINKRANSGNSIIETPLSCAVRNKNLGAIKELLNAGADPNIYTSSAKYDGGTTLHIIACEYNNYSEAKTVINALIKAGADINHHYKFSRAEIKEFEQWNSFPRYRTPWTLSSPWGNLFEDFSNAGMNDFLSSCTPLMYAVVHDNADVVNILLDAGADPNIRNLENKTALDYAKALPASTKIRSSRTFKRLSSLTK